MTAEVRAINFDLARKLTFGLNGRANGFADLVRQNERRFLLDAQVTRQRQHALAFDLIAEDRDRGEVIADR